MGRFMVQFDDTAHQTAKRVVVEWVVMERKLRDLTNTETLAVLFLLLPLFEFSSVPSIFPHIGYFPPIGHLGVLKRFLVA